MNSGKSQVSRVFFNKPISGEIKPPGPPGRPTVLSYQEVQDLCRQLRTEGFDIRAIVIKRVMYTNGQPDIYNMSRPINWGSVVDLRSTSITTSGQPYFPLKVQWVKDGSISEHWPEDVFLLHKAMSQYEIENVIKEQMIYD
jgi:hypothetical protein